MLLQISKFIPEVKNRYYISDSASFLLTMVKEN